MTMVRAKTFGANLDPASARVISNVDGATFSTLPISKPKLPTKASKLFSISWVIMCLAQWVHTVLSVRLAARQKQVFLRQCERFLPAKFLRRDQPFLQRQNHLPEKLGVIEADPRRVLNPEAIINFPDPRPVDRSEAHRARLASGVDVASIQRESIEIGAGIPDG